MLLEVKRDLKDPEEAELDYKMCQDINQMP